ncbi:DUF5956 family protein [Nocardioides campestrisoli]|uniref:DUF5956 family protein n=1 Tax=Nocardioides campestrisoli TaxID=2736757 RepID=UPI00163DC8C9|nr:DUF5956 family protein [Nocardioides campestrisoli]
MTDSWDDVPLLDGPPTEAPPGERWQPVDEYGPGVLVLWCLRARAASAPLGESPVTQVTEEVGGMSRSWSRPRSAREQAEVDQDVDELLVDAGLPPRPAGRQWFLRLPAALDLAASVSRWSRGVDRLLEGRERSPATEVEAFRELLAAELGD